MTGLPRMTIAEAAGWALAHFYHEDRANAVMHCAPVRFSPITFRLAEALTEAGMVMNGSRAGTDLIVAEILRHRGQYEEDSGR